MSTSGLAAQSTSYMFSILPTNFGVLRSGGRKNAASPATGLAAVFLSRIDTAMKKSRKASSTEVMQTLA